MVEPKWVSQRHAADFLCVSERTLLRFRQAGVLQPGEPYRRKFQSERSGVVYDLLSTAAQLKSHFQRDHRILEQA